MAKKQKEKGSGVQNRPAYSRVSFLYQAAALLATSRQDATIDPTVKAVETTSTSTSCDPAPEQVRQGNKTVKLNRNGDTSGKLQGMSRRLVTDLRQVGLKTQIRMDTSIKRTLCKFCDTLLIDGESCTSFVENKSKDASKPWADVLVVKCETCQREKRFPIAAVKQKRRPLRTNNVNKDTQGNAVPDAEMLDT